MKKFSTKFFIWLILIVGFFVYVNALPNGFVWDDEEQIANNLVIRNWSNLPLVFTSSTFYAGGAGLSGGFYRPLVTLSYFINYHLWGLNPFGFRLFQFLFHLANLILIFLILRKIFLSQKIKYSDEISALAVLLFAVHPANVESVVYLGSIGEILYTFLGFLSFWFFLKYSTQLLSYSPQGSPDFIGTLRGRRELANIKNNKFVTIVQKLLWRREKYFLLGFISVFLALFAKESAVVFFPLIALYFFIFVKPRFQFWLKYTLSTAASLSAYLFLRFFVAKIPTVSTHFAPISTASFLERLQTIPYEIVSYLRIIFFPKDLSISQHFVVSSISDIRFWGSLIFLLIVLLLAAFYVWRYSRTEKSKLVIFFILWFFVVLSPALNILPLEMTIAERWLYFPIIGFLALLSFLLFQLKEWFDKLTARNLPKFGQKILFVFVVFILLVLSGRTIIRNSNWKDGLTIFSHDIQYSKSGSTGSPQGSFDLENNYGVGLFRTGKFDEAEEHFRKSIELQPRWTYPHNNLGAVLEKKGDLEGALAEYKKATELSDYYLAYENIGGILFKMRKYEEAKDFLLNALQKFPRNANLKWQLALVYLTENDTEKATSLLFSALQNDPKNLKVRQLLEAMQPPL